MAAMEKYTDSMVLYKLRHVTRESGKLPSNIDIDHNLSGKNYSLAPPDRGTTARENKRYYNKFSGSSPLLKISLQNRKKLFSLKATAISIPCMAKKIVFSALFM